MPNEPLFFALRDNRKTALEGMSEAEGYWYNYGEVILGGAAVWGKGHEWAAPPVYMRYLGEAGGDPVEGAEQPYRSFRRFDVFEMSVPIKDEDAPFDHELKARRVQMDIHTALMADTTCGASGGVAGRPRCTDLSDLAWEPAGATTEPEGGILRVRYAVRYEHITGDMSSADH